MNKILIRSATIIDPSSPENGKVRDILIQDGSVARLGERIRAAGAGEVDARGAYASPGWMDMHANLGDPGFETKEDFISGTAAAASRSEEHTSELQSLMRISY